jgi:hypothetical protein
MTYLIHLLLVLVLPKGNNFFLPFPGLEFQHKLAHLLAATLDSSKL